MKIRPSMNKPQSLPANASGRILSIDIFRGLTILVMVFVNDVASVKGLPWWTYHIPPGVQGMTYVDVVFPAFLFIVGMAIPLASAKRLGRGDSIFRILYHIILRSLSLVVLGLLIMNGRAMDPSATGISYALWNVLMFTGVILFWNLYPKTDGRGKLIFKILKWLGLAILVILLILYRRKSNAGLAWIDPENWAILGGIGWAYLTVGILFLLFKKRTRWLLVALVVLVLLNMASKAGWVEFLQHIPRYLWPVGTGSLASITLAGLILSLVFLKGEKSENLKGKYFWSLIYAVVLAMAGWLLMPYGLAKIGSTPSWCLFSSAICVLIFIFMYWLVDLKGFSGWAGFMKPAGSNPLLTYLLPDIYYAIFGLYHFSSIAGEGWPGVARALLFSLFILAVSALMTRSKIRLQL